MILDVSNLTWSVCQPFIWLPVLLQCVCLRRQSAGLCRFLRVFLDLGFQSIQRPLEDLWKTHTHRDWEDISVFLIQVSSLTDSRNSSHWTRSFLSFPICSSHLISLCLIFTLITFCRLHRTHTVWFTTHTHTHTHTHTVSVSQISCFLSSWCQLYFKLLKPYLKAFYLCEISDWNWMFNEIKCRQRLEFNPLGINGAVINGF